MILLRHGRPPSTSAVTTVGGGGKSLILFLCRHGHLRIPPPTPKPVLSKSEADDYFTTVHHLSSIVRRDHFLERTLNRLRLPPLSGDLILRVIRAAAPSAPIPALRFLSWARSAQPSSFAPSAAHFDALLLPLASNGHITHLWSLVSHMSSLSLPLRPSTFAAIIHSYGRAHKPDLAVEVFNRVTHFRCPQTTEIYNSLLSALVQARNIHGARALIRRMARKNVQPDRSTFATLVDAWCADGKMKDAEKFLGDMEKKGFLPPCGARDLIIDGLVSAGRLDEAKELALQMTREGRLPDATALNNLLGALCAAGDVDFAVALLDDAAGRGLCLDISTYKALIPAVARVGKIEEAFRMYYTALEDGHRPFPSLYASLIKALCKAGRFADAFAFFRDVKRAGHPPNRPVYTMLVRMCARGGRYEDAANYLLEMREMGFAPRAQSFESVIDGLRHCGKYDLAHKIEQFEVSLLTD